MVMCEVSVTLSDMAFVARCNDRRLIIESEREKNVYANLTGFTVTLHCINDI